ncbi:MAG: hypothetical protein R6V04_11805 [bacterium]
MEKTLHIINQMHKQGLFKQYAIGGGIAALFYIEPFATFDLDIFLLLTKESESLISLSSLYQWLKKKGYKTIKEQIVIEGIPVQFIPAYNELVNEAVLHSIKKKYKAETTFVLRPEYLLAIMVQTNRPKDRDRMLKLIEETEISNKLLEKILNKYNLKNKYTAFKKKFYGQ